VCETGPGSNSAPVLGSKVARTADLREDRPRRCIFTRREYALDDFKHVAKCAYFDYQREKILVRTDKKLKAINRRHRKLKRTKLQPNTTVRLELERCPKCRKKAFERLRERGRLLIDLKFSKTGVKKWVTRTISGRYRCLNCQHQSSSEILPPVPSL